MRIWFKSKQPTKKELIAELYILRDSIDLAKRVVNGVAPVSGNDILTENEWGIRLYKGKLLSLSPCEDIEVLKEVILALDNK